MAKTRVRWNYKAIRELRTDPQVVAFVERVAGDMGQEMAALAPKDTGAGAASIGVHPGRAKGSSRVGWDAEHFYMLFPEIGTEHQSAQRFSRNVLDRYTIR